MWSKDKTLAMTINQGLTMSCIIYSKNFLNLLYKWTLCWGREHIALKSPEKRNSKHKEDIKRVIFGTENAA